MKDELHWEPSIRLEDGLREVYDWAAKELDAEGAAVKAGGTQ